MSLKTEQEHHKKAFEVFYGLGDGRSYRAVAGQLGVSTSAVKLWSRSFGWVERIRECDARVARELADRSVQSGVQEGERNLKIVRAALLRLAKDIAEGRIKGQLSDLARLMELERSLLPPPSHTGAGVHSPTGVIVYLPDNGRDPNQKVYTLDELEEAGHDVAELRRRH